MPFVPNYPWDPATLSLYRLADRRYSVERPSYHRRIQDWFEQVDGDAASNPGPDPRWKGRVSADPARMKRLRDSACVSGVVPRDLPTRPRALLSTLIAYSREIDAIR